MYLYIDIENLESFIRANKHKLYNDCFKLLQRQLSVYFNFSKKELKSNELLVAWSQLLTEGVGEKNTHKYLDEYKFPKRPLNTGCYLEFSSNQLSAIYLINDELVEILKEEGAILIGSPGEEIETLQRVFLSQDDYDFHKELKIGSELFSKWDDMSKYSLPLTDIIFIDSYILSDASLIESNFIKYLSVLSTKAKCSINIILYVNIRHVSVSFQFLKEKIAGALKLTTGCDPAITMVQYSDQRGQESLAEHDRTILTNYTRIKSGDTYNYFNSVGAVISKGREVSYLSLGKYENHELAKVLLTDLQQRIDFLKENGNGDAIQGDKKSNFINFL